MTSPVPAHLSVPGVTHRHVAVSGLTMHVAEAGHGDPVLLLHGFPQHWWEWRDVIPALARQYRVIAPDLRGAGWTDAPSGSYTRDTQLGDLTALLDALGHDQVRVIAHDYSALLGYRLCLTHPDRVRSYVALGPPPMVDVDLRVLPQAWRLWFQPVLALPGIGAQLLGEGRQRLARYLFKAHTPRHDLWTDELLEPFLARLREPARASAGSALYRQFIVPEVLAVMRGEFKRARLTTPTVALHGAADTSLPAALLGTATKYADHLRVRVVEGAAHFIADEQPEVVVEEALTLFTTA